MTFLLLTAAALVNGAIGGELRITSVSEFIQFKDNVNSGTSYEGTTVFLDSDLSFARKSFKPIGNRTSKYFNGTFDGQGHVISNLKMKSSLWYTGIFGYSEGLTIKNVVLDSSCSIKNSYSGFNGAYIGGIIGYCEARNGVCIIENSVNMGSVTFSGNVSGSGSFSLYLGGIAGHLSSYFNKYDSAVKNCANYGDVAHPGESRNSFIGGVIGRSGNVYIYNSINHGTITHNGTTSDELILGGITGFTSYTTIENCVSGGKISSANSGGSIVECVYDGTSINYTYYTSELSGYKKYGFGTPSSESNISRYNSTTLKLGKAVSIGSYTGKSLINALNAVADYYTLRDHSHWLLNKRKKPVTFTINGRTNSIKMNYQVILLPSLASEGNMSFYGWYTDDGLTKPLTKFEVTSDTQLYGFFCSLSNFTVTFDVNGGDELQYNPAVIVCNEVYLTLPTPTRTEATFTGWYTDATGGSVVKKDTKVTNPNNHTLYAHWSINQYTLTFEVNGGSACEEITQDYNTAVELPKPTKTGYTFAYWCSDIELANKYEGATMPAENKTLYAKWNINRYTLTFVFNNGTEPEDEVRTLDYNEEIVYPEGIKKTGYTFNEWVNKQERMPAENITITARWTANEYTVTFEVNGGNALSESESKKQVAYDSTYGGLPEPSRTGYSFIGWFTDAEEGEEITNEIPVNVLSNHTLYAHWSINNYTLTFIFGNGTEPDVQVLEYNEAITCPADPVRAGYSFAGWDRNITNMPADNTTITAQWTVNNYTVTFNPSGGSISQSTKVVTFGSIYGELPNATRTGYAFLGWFSEKNESVTEESIMEIPGNHTLYAQWLEITQSQVEIVFSTKDMGKEEIEEVIRKYTDADFTITVIESITDEVRVIVEFIDVEKANEFVREVNAALEQGEGEKIKRADFVQGTDSFSPAYHPMNLLFLI